MAEGILIKTGFGSGGSGGSSSESTANETFYITGVKTAGGDSVYNPSINFNPSTGTINASIINADKVYGAVWNDYAEWFEKENLEEEFEPGDICVWNNTGVTKSNSNNKNIIGIYSNSYGHILGGESLDDMSLNNKKFVPIGLVGRVKVKVVGVVNIGDYIVCSDIPGVGRVDNDTDLKYVVGKSLENKNYEEMGYVTIFIK